MKLLKKYKLFSDLSIPDWYFGITELMYAFEVLTHEHSDIATTNPYIRKNNCVLPTSDHYSDYSAEIIYPIVNQEGITFGFKFKAKKGVLDITINSRGNMYDVYSGDKIRCLDKINEKIKAVTSQRLEEKPNSIIDHVSSYSNNALKIPQELVNKYKKVFNEIDEVFSEEFKIGGKELEISFKIDNEQIAKIKNEIDSKDKDRSDSLYTFLYELESERKPSLYINTYTAEILFDFNIIERGSGTKQIVNIKNIPAFSIPGIIEFLAKLFR